MNRIATLSPAHQHLRVNPTHGLAFGDGVRLVPVITAEFADLALDIPILVVRDGDTGAFFAAALMGFDEGENLFVDGTRWLAAHKPLDLQRRPFFAAMGDDGADVLIDTGSPRVGLRGEPLFDADGEPSPFLEHIRSLMSDLLRGQETTRLFLARLLDLNLLAPVNLTIAFADGERGIDGVFVVRRDTLASLPDATVAALHRAGELELIHLMLASLGHLAGLIRRKEDLIEQQRSAAAG